MKKRLLILIAVMCGMTAFAKNDSTSTRIHPVLKGLSFGPDIPIECRDIKAAGLDMYIGFDAAYPVTQNLALGFYINGGGGFLGEFKHVYDADNYYGSFKLTAGLMMEIGDRAQKPFLVGICPATGFGLLDMDLVLPLEVRFGRFILDKWYIMGELTYNISLANETVSIEPAIRIGYNFGK